MKVFRIGERVRFTADWAEKITPNFGVVSDKKSKDPKCIFVKFDVEAPPANILMVPVDKLESDE
jgi:hypothetical protein